MPEFKPALTGNYTIAQRPADVSIHYIVIHATELNYLETLARFQSLNHVSAHTVIRQHDGHRTEMVLPKDVAWHAGNWDMNCRSLGIEQEAYVTDAASFTEPMLNALVTQISEWSSQYYIPLDRAHLLGHDNVAAPNQKAQVRMHRDPGWYFDWEGLFQKLGIASMPDLPVKVGQGVRIKTRYADLHQQPDPESPVIGNQSDTLTYRASYGQEFVCVAEHGDWLAIYFNGQRAWCRQSQVSGIQRPILKVSHETAIYGSTQLGTPAIGLLQPDEQYVISDELNGLQTSDTAGHLTAHKTNEIFEQIWYGHRIAYVKASEKNFKLFNH